MFSKTTNIGFQPYGEIVNLEKNPLTFKVSRTSLRLKDKIFSTFMCYDHDVYIHTETGIVLLVVSLDKDASAYERFVIHREVKIRKGVYFNFISISASARIQFTHDIKAKKTTIALPKDTPVFFDPIIPTFEINEILSYFYQVRNASYEFNGEKHEYWELTFIDNGALTTVVDGEEYNLEEMDLILYAPGQYHTQHTGHAKSCSYLTILFEMKLPDSYLITDRVYHAHRDMQNALNNFMKVSENDMLYEGELMLCYLKELIIRILQYDFLSASPPASTPMQQRFENEMLNEIIVYINEMIYKQLTIEEVCNKFSISRSSLQLLFKNNLGVAPKQYISDLKLNKSKLLIKESMYTISEIAGMLGFTSIHYFSRKFKQHFGITPSDYAKTIYN